MGMVWFSMVLYGSNAQKNVASSAPPSWHHAAVTPPDVSPGALRCISASPGAMG